ncbi:MAG: hypothetical protein KIT84_41755 [Labilithrix sp.]|nr:hypothetical protein [Labilithrix sp.]MCW5817599.1 hypothetical protein [Labilithrix sp.]
MKNRRWGRWLALVVASVALGAGCSERANEAAPSARSGGERAGSVGSAVTLTPNQNAAILLPSGRELADIAIAAGDGISIDPHASVVASQSGAAGLVFNAGLSKTLLSTWSQARDVVSVGPVELKNRATVDGDVTSAGAVLRH